MTIIDGELHLSFCRIFDGGDLVEYVKRDLMECDVVNFGS